MGDSKENYIVFSTSKIEQSCPLQALKTMLRRSGKETDKNNLANRGYYCLRGTWRKNKGQCFTHHCNIYARLALLRGRRDRAFASFPSNPSVR